MSEPPSMLRRKALYPSPLVRYKLMGVIGQGAFSEVWAALDRNPDKGRPYVAVKCCKPTSSNQPSAEVEVLREIRQKAHGSRHPGASRIMPLLDDFIVPASKPSSPGLFHQCIVTELVMCLSDDWYSQKIMASLIRQIMDAFDFLHSHHVIHGDPHIGNIGVEIGSLQGVTESEMEESLYGGRATWMSTLMDLDTATLTRTPPDETYDMRIKILDFGRGKFPGKHINIGYLVAAGDKHGLPDRKLLGNNPIYNRPPEVDMFQVTGGKVGVPWSPSCDIWALGSMMFSFARGFNLVSWKSTWKQEETRVVARCLVGGVPPAHWLQHYKLGAGLIEYLQDTDPTRLPKNREQSVNDIHWIQQEMQFQHEKLWKHDWAKVSKESLFADPVKFPFNEFFAMVRAMTDLDVGKRLTMADVSRHAFWKLFEPAQCYDEW